MKPIILITSCIYHLSRNEQCRATWLKKWGWLVDYKFIFGQGRTPICDDELVLSVEDSYQGLPAKIQASHKWALEQGYDYILKTDCDVYLHIPRLLNSGFEQYPYSGNIFWPSAKIPFALGSAYWLDKNASQILINSKLPAYPANGGDDVWVGRVMFENKIDCHHEKRYCVGKTPDWDNDISFHVSDLNLSMTEIHNRMALCA